MTDIPAQLFLWPAEFNGDIPISHVRASTDYRKINYDQAVWFNTDFAQMARDVFDQSVGNIDADTDVVHSGVRAALSGNTGFEWFKKIAARPPDSEFDCANHLEAVLSRVLNYNTDINKFMIYDESLGVWQADMMSWGDSVGSVIDQIINLFGTALNRSVVLLKTLGGIAAPAPGPQPANNASQGVKQAWNRADVMHKEMLAVVKEVERVTKALFDGRYKQIIDAFKRRMGKPQTAWDADVRWVVLKDGVLNVDEIYRTGEVNLYPFSPEHRSTMCLDVALSDALWGGGAHVGESEWDKGVTKVLPDPEIRHYLQKRFGGALLGRPGIAGKSMVWQYGVGDTAKSSLQECIAGSHGVFAPYSLTSSSKALTTKGERTGAGDRFKAYARGKRFAILSELDDGDQLAQSDLKVMTGGESVEGTAKYANAVTYYFTATIFMASNHPPTFPPGDTAAKNRIHVVPFTHKLFIRSKDPEGWEKAPETHRAVEDWAPSVLSSPTERAAILRWVLDGLILFGREGVGVLPAAMQEAAEEFAADGDPVARLVNSLLGLEPGYENRPALRLFTEEEWKDYGYSEGDALSVKDAEYLIEVRAYELGLVKLGDSLSQKWLRGAKSMLAEKGAGKKKVRLPDGNSGYAFTRMRQIGSMIGSDIRS